MQMYLKYISVASIITKAHIIQFTSNKQLIELNQCSNQFKNSFSLLRI